MKNIEKSKIKKGEAMKKMSFSEKEFAIEPVSNNSNLRTIINEFYNEIITLTESRNQIDYLISQIDISTTTEKKSNAPVTPFEHKDHISALRSILDIIILENIALYEIKRRLSILAE